MLHLSHWSPLLVHWTSCKTQLPSRNTRVPFLTWVCYVLDWKEIMHIWNELRALKVHCFPTHTVYLFEMKSPSIKEKWPSLRSLKKTIPIKKECTSFQAMWHPMNMSIEYVCGKRMQNRLVVHLPLWKIWKSDWIIIPTIGENKVMFQTTNQKIWYPCILQIVFSVVLSPVDEVWCPARWSAMAHLSQSQARADFSKER